ncbi:ABC transporter ATP-binding protein [Inquilinus sp. CA228]|uniref:ABC transporter ATP-binding protein n=1 Tax=Inquilinus sp. CA228 TaxID=3455609 RepID=UPI003F8D5CF9
MADLATTGSRSSLLQAQNVRVHFPIRKGFLKRVVGHVRAVDGISLAIRPGETLSLVGESGCGKTTLGQALVRVIEPTDGRILYHRGAGDPVDLAHLGEAALRPYRSEIRMIFQDPFASLNPRRRVIDIIGEGLRNFGVTDEAEVEARVAALLGKVGLRPEYMSRYPYAFSGGERQRIGIARALAPRPKLVVADECVSALDVSVRAQTLNLLQDLQEEFDLTYLFISHDLSVVEYISDRVAVMYAGRIVELAETEPLFARPRHPYTAALLAAVPRPDPRMARAPRRLRLGGEVADPANRPTGCAFHPRCPFATDLCRVEDPAPRVVSGHQVACHHAETLDHKGVMADAARQERGFSPGRDVAGGR